MYLSLIKSMSKYGKKFPNYLYTMHKARKKLGSSFSYLFLVVFPLLVMQWHSFLQGWYPLFSDGTPSPFWVLSSFWCKFKKLPPLSESHPNWYMQIVRNTLKWRCYLSYYTKTIENIINITLFTFRINSVCSTDTSFS